MNSFDGGDTTERNISIRMTLLELRGFGEEELQIPLSATELSSGLANTR